jgi:hypothetical protein
LIRDGLDLYAGQVRRFHIEGFAPSADPFDIQGEWVFVQMYLYGHMLFDPPNVAGWPGHRSWINSFTLPVRKFLSATLVDGRLGPDDLGFQIDVMAETSRLSDPEDVEALVNDLSLLCFGMPPTDVVRQAMLDEVLQGELPSYWSMDLPDADVRLQDLYRYAMRLPDYQLK